jgi:hypothetical protein
MSTAPVFVEVLDRHNTVTQRTRLDALPARIGRGYECEVIVDDPFMAPVHAELRLDAAQELVLVDAGSRNGTRRIGHRPTAPGEHIVAHDAVYELGKTRLRIRDTGVALAPERTLAGEWRIPVWVEWVSMIALFAVVAFEAWFDMVNEVKPLDIVKAVGATCALLSIWAGIWALVNRLFHGISHYRKHLALATIGLLVSVAFMWISDITAFALNWAWLSNWRSLGFFVLVSAVILGHLAIANGQIKRGSAVTVGIIGIAAMALSIGSTYQSQKRFAPNAFMATVLPPSWRLAPASDVSKLTGAMDAAKAHVDALRKETSDSDLFGE